MVELAGKKVVITGATGFIGRNVASTFMEAGAEVYVLVRPQSRQKTLLPVGKHLHILSGDMEHVETALRQACLLPVSEGTSSGADLFLHFAWGGVNREEIDSFTVQEYNIKQSVNCLRAARALGCQVFMDAGSRMEYGVTSDGTMEESMECHPVSEYGKAKLIFYRRAKSLCESWGTTYYHLRFFSVYGLGDHPWSVISTLTRDLPLGKTVPLSACIHLWNFMHVKDASYAVLELYRHSDFFAGQIHTVNVASADTRRLREFVEEIHKLCGGLGNLEYGAFVQGRESALSVCPVIKELIRLTEGTWEEKISFYEGISGMLYKKT